MGLSHFGEIVNQMMIRIAFVMCVVFLVGAGWACSTTALVEDDRQQQERLVEEASFSDEAAEYDVAYRIGTTLIDDEPVLEVELHFDGLVQPSGRTYVFSPVLNAEDCVALPRRCYGIASSARLALAAQSSTGLRTFLRRAALDRTSTNVYLPSRWAHVDNYHEGIIRMEVAGEGVELVETDYVNMLEVRHRPGQRVVLRYAVRQIFSEGLYANRYRPHIADDHFFFIGHGFFIMPDFDMHEQRPILIQWDVDDDYEVLANSHGRFTARQSLHTDLDSIRGALYLGGDYQYISSSEAGVDFVFYGDDWSFEIAEFVEKTLRIVEAGRELFADLGADPWLVAIYPGDEPGYWMGTALHDAVVLRLKLEEDFDWTPILELIAHEVVHQWNGQVLQREQPSEQYFWFSEGFTDFYTARVLLQAELIDLVQYADFFNRLRMEYASSPAREATNEEIVEGFWRDGDIQRIPYLRGALFALHLDTEIRLESQGKTSLDDVMARKIEAGRRDGTRFSKDLFIEALQSTQPTIADQVQSIIIEGAALELHPHGLGPCGSTETVELQDVGQIEIYTVDEQRWTPSPRW